MEAFILEDMDELETARLIIGGYIQSGDVRDPGELRFSRSASGAGSPEPAGGRESEKKCQLIVASVCVRQSPAITPSLEPEIALFLGTYLAVDCNILATELTEVFS